MSIINISIIDQRLVSIQDQIRQQAQEELNIRDDEERLKSLAFVYLCVKTILDIDEEEAFDCLTEGGGDFGVDALHITAEGDGEFGVVIFQGKYKRSLDGKSEFGKNGIEAMINAIKHLFDPSSSLGGINARLHAKVEEARSLIRDGLIPRVRAIACNNGRKWGADAQASIERFGSGDQVSWEHVNHDVLVGILQNTKPISETLRLTGEAVVEDMNFSRVCIGRIPVTEVASLMRNHGERLLERNIRRYLGLHKNRVNEGIQDTLMNQEESKNFYFFNNGLTLVCDDFSHNALQSRDFHVKVENLQVVNGGQTCMTILKTYEELAAGNEMLPQDATVLLRIYKLPKDDVSIVPKITYATNSQNPVDLKGLRANDDKQRALEQSIEGLGYDYRRKRSEVTGKATDITSGAAAEAVLAVWRKEPHRAKFFAREHFGKLYDKIFTDALNGAQVVSASLLYRIAENHRRRPHPTDPDFVRYASCFIAMQMGKKLLESLGIGLDGLDHRTFERAKKWVEANGEACFKQSCQDIQNALKSLYGQHEISMQQLSATFRRGDLIEKLQ